MQSRNVWLFFSKLTVHFIQNMGPLNEDTSATLTMELLEDSEFRLSTSECHRVWSSLGNLNNTVLSPITESTSESISLKVSRGFTPNENWLSLVSLPALPFS